MAKCTGVRCPMQHGYKTEECNQTDCPWRTEPMTNADKIRSMSDEELAELLAHETYRIAKPVFDLCGYGIMEEFIFAQRLKWLKQPAEE